jgi:hypothetical protein
MLSSLTPEYAAQFYDPSRSTPRVCISQLFDGLIRLDVLIEPQHIPGIVLFLDLHQPSIVGRYAALTSSLLVSPN